ncbi:4-alpha-glucanotransferase [Candidatus Omnitrophota bacterium]
MSERRSGVLLHISSLPSTYGIGDFGQKAYEFADFLADTKQKLWQILPLNPTNPVCDNSPYHSTSAFAFNPLLISPELLVRDGLLKKKDIESPPKFPKKKVDFGSVIEFKQKLLLRAYENFRKRNKNNDLLEICTKNEWVEDFALFMALKSHHKDVSWHEWAPEAKNRDREFLQSKREELSWEIGKHYFYQHIANTQWNSLKQYCNKKEISIIGDIPIYVDYDSADVWSNPELFKLDSEKRPYAVAGVPPDYFSKTGQLWGNPIYNWDVIKDRGFEWWIKRIRHNLSNVDILRIDHFRGLVGYWEIPAGEKTAMNGKWVQAPANEFFTKLTGEFRGMPFIAEDLGIITDDVNATKERFGFPGMKVLLFAFGDDFPNGTYLPHNIEKHCIMYTGTHDNNTTRGWYENDATPQEKDRLRKYLGEKINISSLPWELVRMAMMSTADTVIIPMQDILGLDKEARMNRPFLATGNWQWRISPGLLKSSVSNKLRGFTEVSGRG